MRVEGMCGYIQVSAFAELRHGRRRESQIDFEVLSPVERLRNQMKRTAGFVLCDRGVAIGRELTIQVRRKHSMDRANVNMTRIPMVMVGLGMDMNQWRGKHP